MIKISKQYGTRSLSLFLVKGREHLWFYPPLRKKGGGAPDVLPSFKKEGGGAPGLGQVFVYNLFRMILLRLSRVPFEKGQTCFIS